MPKEVKAAISRLLEEDLVPLAVIARETPGRNSRGVNVRTVWRWATKGIRGHVLESCIVGGLRMSSREAATRLFSAISADAHCACDCSQPDQRQHAIEKANRELDAAGI